MGCKRKKGSRSLDDHEFQNDRWFWGWWRCSVLLWVLLRPTMFPKPMLDYLHMSSHDDKCGSYHEIRMSQGELLISNKSTGIGLVCRAKCSQNASIGRQRIPILGGEVVGFANKWENITWNPVLFFYSVPELLNSCSLLWAWFRIRHQICSDGFLNVRSWKCHTFKSAVGLF